ncbi:gliding motility-associated C-terminal domain-containing protein [Xanthocytophaga agilis]|uniref:Gliding motility-associated C-terminal domain-containing protein n=1 Tax=Xanthocytophaga agilis TaxID=3048010 RepID=A0AAE3UIN0_9BACT|nr:gliding motility-associated C-terminal domain-containing protein [Xanthocytophaga agilis]MDJ1506805.1 gliding motility-associated C-terminal domain-containing protein [Xanthocytophaga agilis]
MNTENERIDWIEAYLSDSLSPEQKAVFTRQLQTDPTLSEEVELHRMANELIVDHALLDLKAKMITQYRPQYQQTNYLRGNRGSIWLVTGIVVLVALVGSVVYFKDKSTSGSKEISIQPIPQTEKPASLPTESVPELSTSKPKEVPDNTPKKPVPEHSVSIVKNNSTNAKDSALVSIPISVIPIPEKESAKPVEHPVTKEGSRYTPSKITPPAFKQPEVNCAGIQFTIAVQTEKSCSDGSSGKIICDLASIKGGTPPYQLSINKGASFRKTRQFEYLSPGIYYLTIKDASGCQYTLAEGIEIQAKDCTAPQEYAFSPDLGQVWTFPFGNDTKGTLQIFNREGVLVYRTEIHNGFPGEWNGQGNQGIPVPMGHYRFLFDEGKGKQTQGSVSVLR